MGVLLDRMLENADLRKAMWGTLTPEERQFITQRLVGAGTDTQELQQPEPNTSSAAIPIDPETGHWQGF